jgi:Arc/MetJ-type ribon-helix-helix transcriptional regulator
MPRNTITISLPKELKKFVTARSRTAHFGTTSSYIQGLIREDLKHLEQEQLEIELMKGLKGKGIAMTPAAWKRMRAEAAQIITSKRS